jgi:MYXO-CTERM domain-containing protein
MKRTALTAAALALALAAPAHAHELEGYIAPSGLGFLSEQLPGYLPPHLSPPAMTMEMFTCPLGRVVTFTQRDTEIDLLVDEAELSVPAPGIMRASLKFDVFADGEAYIEYPYACFGSATCSDQLSLLDGRAIIDFTTTVDASGKPRVTVASIELLVDEDDVVFQLSDCAIDDVVNWVIDFGKGWLLDMLVDKLEALAQDQMAPWLEGMVGSFLQFDGTIAIAEFDFQINGIEARSGGLFVGGDADLFSSFPLDACLGADPGEPQSHAGAAPDPSAGASAHIGLALNLGLVDDMLYQVWREGMTCLTADHLRALGLDLDLEEAASLLPGFPAGSEIDIEMRLAVPPRIEGNASDAAMLTLVADGIEIDLTARTPDGETTRLSVEAGAKATATIGLDPSINALTLQVDAVELTHLAVDEDYAAETGLDVAQLQTLAESVLIPTLLDEVGDLPVTGPIFGFADYYIILREIRTTASHVIAKADLFRAPATDSIAPNTQIVGYPTQVVRPADSLVRATATDDKIPTELLRYRFSIDGVPQPPTYLTALQVGESSKSGTYRVAVSAIDLHDNEDPSPDTVDVTVDGVRPKLRLETDKIVQLDSAATSVSVAWTATDDLTPPERIAPSVALYRIVDPQEITSAVLIGETDLSPGTSEGSLSVEQGERYRIVVTVRDEAGNATYTSVIVHVAGEPGGCGCSQTGGDPGSGLPIALALAALLVRRRRNALVRSR